MNGAQNGMQRTQYNSPSDILLMREEAGNKWNRGSAEVYVKEGSKGRGLARGIGIGGVVALALGGSWHWRWGIVALVLASWSSLQSQIYCLFRPSKCAR
jgi:hypothetical protein